MKKIISTFILLIFICLPSFSEVTHITIDRAVDLAIENNLDLKSKRKKAEELKQEIKMANALKNPQFQSNFLMGKVTRGNSSQFGLAIPIEINKRSIRKKIAQTNLEIVENEIRASEHDLKIEIMRNYFNVLYMKSIVNILQEREKLFKNMKTIAEQKPKNSPNYDIDLIQSDIKYKKQIVFLNRAKANLLEAQFKLNETMNIKDSQIMYDTLESSLFSDNLTILNLNLLPYNEIENTAMKYSYGLAIADSNIQKSEQEISQAERKRIPDITIAGGYAYQTAKQTGGEALPGAFVGANAELPLFYTFRPEIKRAKIVLERKSLDKESFENHLRYALKRDYNNFKYAKENMIHYQDILKESKNILNMHSRRYEKGQSSFLNLLQVETMYQETLRDYIEAMEIYYNSYLDLMHNVGHDILLQQDL